MKNKKGFTLIELLAVIIILAIIALIATPIVMRVIENAKKGAADRSSDNYKRAVELAIMEAKIDKKDIKGDYYIGEDGNLHLILTDRITEDKPIEITVSGERPTYGSVKIGSDDDPYALIGYSTQTEEPICQYYASNLTTNQDGTACSGTCSKQATRIRKGAKYKCKVNDTTYYDFYIVTFNDSVENGNDNIDLIMDNAQLTASSVWGTSANAGPVNAMEEVIEFTEGWTNVPYINFNENIYSKWNSYKNVGSSAGYQLLTITDGTVTVKNSAGTDTTLSGKARARLLTYKEASDLKCKIGTTNSCYSWVVSGNNVFWLMDNGSNTYPMMIGGYRRIGGSDNLSDSYKIAPVISLPKSAFDWTSTVE